MSIYKIYFNIEIHNIIDNQAGSIKFIFSLWYEDNRRIKPRRLR